MYVLAQLVGTPYLFDDSAPADIIDSYPRPVSLLKRGARPYPPNPRADKASGNARCS